jgi:hypothetical protein
MFESLKSNLKWLAALIVACCLAFGAGYAYKEPTVQVEEKIVEKVIEKIVEVEKKKKQKVTKVTQKPDGTTTTTVIDTTEDTNTVAQESDHTTEHTQTKPGSGDAYRPTYSAGVDAVTDFKSLSPSYRVSLGYRVLGNAWVTSSFDIQRTELSAGVRVDF